MRIKKDKLDSITRDPIVPNRVIFTPKAMNVCIGVPRGVTIRGILHNKI